MSDLKNEQLEVYNKYIEGKNIFITGPGGTGKTHLIKAIVKDLLEKDLEKKLKENELKEIVELKEKDKSFKVCAMTGCAAILLMCGATTLHTFAGIGLAKGTIEEVVEKVVKNRHKRPNWHKTNILIVDEVSMLSLKIFMILDLIARKIKKQPLKPFGGMQIIFSGDFYQLPPVGNNDEPDTTKFCFESVLWNETFPQENQIQLKTMFRQTDPKYIKILNGIRVGKITNSTITTLTACVNKKDKDEAKPTILLPRRKDADIINNKELNKLDSTNEKEYLISQVPELELSLTKEQTSNLSLFTPKEREYEVQNLSESVIVEKKIKLRIGTVVMCTVNLNVDSETPIVNGSQGIVKDFTKEDNPIVEFTNGLTQIIQPYTWMSERMHGIAIKQLPLIYAWAITIHKSQGVTLDKAFIDIGSGIFECGQTYVALSRIKTLEGLYLKRFDYKKITINKKVQEFYKKLNNLVV